MVVMSSIYRQLRDKLTYALGESQTENPWVASGIALEVIRAELEASLASSEETKSEVQQLLAR